MKTYLARFAIVLFGLVLYALGIAITINANIGYAPWDIFHAGLSGVTGLSFGTVSIIVGTIIVILVTVLGEKFGLGTILNVFVIGVILDIIFKFRIIPVADNHFAGAVMLICGMFVISLGSYFYIKSGFGVGPRDNLMVVLSRKTKIPAGICRIIIETIVALIGWRLGGMIWFGTIFFVIGIGFCIQITFTLLKFDVTAVKHESLGYTISALFRKG